MTTSEAGRERGQLSLEIEPETTDLAELLRDGVLRIHVGERRQLYEDRFVAVISRPAGGSVRHYRLCDRGCAHVALPAYEGDWPEMDALVARELRCDVAAGRVYTSDVIHPTQPVRRAVAS